MHGMVTSLAGWDTSRLAAALRRLLSGQPSQAGFGQGPAAAHNTPCLLPLQRSPVQANSSSSKTAGAPTGTVPQQLQVHGAQQSVPVTQEVPGQGGQWQGRGILARRPLHPPSAVRGSCNGEGL